MSISLSSPLPTGLIRANNTVLFCSSAARQGDEGKRQYTERSVTLAASPLHLDGRRRFLMMPLVLDKPRWH